MTSNPSDTHTSDTHSANASQLDAERLARWSQTAATHIAGVTEAPAFIERMGVATLYPVSPELPNLLHAYTGDPSVKATSEWDSVSGEVYTWRWTLGKQGAAFYTALARKRPTWISWELLPAMLRLCGELRTPDELYDAGVISRDAYRIAQALDAAPDSLSTGELRAAAGFPTGKEQRAAYLRAIEELDTRLLLMKVFASDGAADDTDMRHALVARRVPQAIVTAERLTTADALAALLQRYLPNAVYIAPTPFARHLRLPEAELHAALERLTTTGAARAITLPQHRGPCYILTATGAPR